MNRDFEGGCFSIDIHQLALQNEKEVYQLLDAACKLDNLHPISENWRKLTYDDCKTLLQWAFQNELAYPGTRIGKKKTRKFCKLILDKIDPEKSHCFTNWADNPWKEDGGRYWNCITQHTYDIAIVLLDAQQLVFTYLISED